ncbi:MAG: aminopeptidase P family protein [Mucilaginibacter sp.]|nr:aminopeptidase P family protein [Mucilaginibacter sp.]
MNDTKQQLILAQEQAIALFKAVEETGLIVPGKSEQQLNDELVKLAREVFGIDEFWHKKIVRAGANTMEPYGANLPDVTIQDNDIVILDFGPIYNGYEADVARTYVIGNDPLKQTIKGAVEIAWHEANAWFTKQTKLTGAECFDYITSLAKNFGYESVGEIAGHIVGPYPHEQLAPDDLGLDIHPDNHQDMFLKDPHGNDRNWILEVHFADRANSIGAFFEQLAG